MKQLLLLCTVLVSFCYSAAQSMGVGTTTPAASAVLDVSGTSGGLLIPRLTQVQRDAIVNPAKGLLIFCSTDSSIYCYDAAWKRLAPAADIWNLQGNSGTNSGTNFIGTKDTAALVFAVDNVPLLRLFPNGRLNVEGTTSNTIIGNRSGESMTMGYDNVFLGYQAGKSNQNAFINTFIGAFSGANNVSGFLNTFIGGGAGRNNTGGRLNTFIGAEAGHGNVSGEANVMLGLQAGYRNMAGDSNTYLGVHAAFNNFMGPEKKYSSPH